MHNKNSVYSNIAKKDGEYCALCGITAVEAKLTVYDKFGCRTSTEEKILLCIDCLQHKKLYDLCVSERGRIKDDVGIVTELQVNRQKEMKFRLYVYERLSESKNTECEERDLLNSGAEEIGISPTTARRYLDKMCSSAGTLTRKSNGDDIYVKFDTRGLENVNS